MQPGLYSVALLSAVTVGCALVPDTAKTRCPAWTAGEDCSPRMWRTPSAIDGLGKNTAEPGVALGVGGEIILAWTQVSSGTLATVVTAERIDGAWVLRAPSPALPGSGGRARVSIGPTGDALVVWRQHGPGTSYVHVTERRPAGGWIDQVGPTSLGDDSHEPAVAIDEDGDAVIAWNQWTGATYGIALETRDRFEDVTRPSSVSDVISPSILFTNYPQIAVTTAGRAVVSWYQSVGGHLMTFVSERVSSGADFTRPDAAEPLSPDGGAVENPDPAISVSGQAAVAWRQEVGHGDMAVFLATRSAAGAWVKPARLEDSLSQPALLVRDVRVEFAGRDLYLLWQQNQSDSSGVYMAHRGPKWSVAYAGIRSAAPLRQERF